MNKEQKTWQDSTPAERAKGCTVIAVVIIAVILFIVAFWPEDEPATIAQKQVTYDTKPNPGLDSLLRAERLIEKRKSDSVEVLLKAKLAREFPDDYVTQEYWLKEQMESYKFMRWAGEEDIKKAVEKEYPLDFFTQKYWYEEHLEAKQRLK